MNRRELMQAVLGLSFAIGCVASARQGQEKDRYDDGYDRYLLANGWTARCDICGRVARSVSRDQICTGLDGHALRFEPGQIRSRCTKHGPARSLSFYPEQHAPHGEGWYEDDGRGNEVKVA